MHKSVQILQIVFQYYSRKSTLEKAEHDTQKHCWNYDLQVFQVVFANMSDVHKG